LAPSHSPRAGGSCASTRKRIRLCAGPDYQPAGPRIRAQR
jgi:hypothetical protein